MYLLLAGSGGVYSQVRQQLLGISIEDTDMVSMVANTPLTPEVKVLLKGTFLEATSCVFGPDG